MAEALRQNRSFDLKNSLINIDDMPLKKPLYGDSFVNYLVNLRGKKKS